jgi:hypothetical protein
VQVLASLLRALARCSAAPGVHSVGARRRGAGLRPGVQRRRVSVQCPLPESTLRAARPAGLSAGLSVATGRSWRAGQLKVASSLARSRLMDGPWADPAVYRECKVDRDRAQPWPSCEDIAVANAIRNNREWQYDRTDVPLARCYPNYWTRDENDGLCSCFDTQTWLGGNDCLQATEYTYGIAAATLLLLIVLAFAVGHSGTWALRRWRWKKGEARSIGAESRAWQRCGATCFGWSLADWNVALCLFGLFLMLLSLVAKVLTVFTRDTWAYYLFLVVRALLIFLVCSSLFILSIAWSSAALAASSHATPRPGLALIMRRPAGLFIFSALLGLILCASIVLLVLSQYFVDFKYLRYAYWLHVVTYTLFVLLLLDCSVDVYQATKPGGFAGVTTCERVVHGVRDSLQIIFRVNLYTKQEERALIMAEDFEASSGTTHGPAFVLRIRRDLVRVCSSVILCVCVDLFGIICRIVTGDFAQREAHYAPALAVVINFTQLGIIACLTLTVQYYYISARPPRRRPASPPKGGLGGLVGPSGLLRSTVYEATGAGGEAPTGYEVAGAGGEAPAGSAQSQLSSKALARAGSSQAVDSNATVMDSSTSASSQDAGTVQEPTDERGVCLA